MFYNIAKFIVALNAMVIAVSIVLGFVGLLLIAIHYIIDQLIWGYTFVLIFSTVAIFALISIVIGVFTSKIIKKNISGKWIKRGFMGVYSFTAIVSTLGFFVISSMYTMVSGSEKIFRYPKDCESPSSTNLAKVTECNGYGQFGFQNNYDYDIRAYGDADQKLCQKYKQADFSSSFMSSEFLKTPIDEEQLTSIEKAFSFSHECDVNAPAVSWIPTECKFSKYPDITQCYQCARGLSNGNGHRYEQIGFSDDCSRGSYISLAEWRTRLLKKIKNLDTPDDKFTYPKSRGFRSGF